MPPEFSITKILDYGTSHPIVARTSYQTGQILQPFDLTKEQRDELLGIALECQRRLLACWEIGEELKTRESAARAQAETSGLAAKGADRVVETPSIVGLEQLCEQFLYSAKLALRDTARLFKVFFGQHFDENYKNFESWARKELGPEHELTRLVGGNRLWITRLISMRNGVEHPRQRAGPLIVMNLRLAQVGPKLVLMPPTWGQNRGEQTEVVDEMTQAVDAMLAFFEELLILCLLSLPRMIPIEIFFIEIPEEKRDASAPLRYELRFGGFTPPEAQS